MLPTDSGHLITALVTLFRAVCWWDPLYPVTEHLLTFQAFLCNICFVH